MNEIDQDAQDDSTRCGLAVSNDFSHLNEDFLNSHEELEKCFSKLKIGFFTEKELIKERQKALENIKNVYEEVFGENSFRPLHSYSKEPVQELNNDKIQDTLFHETCFYKNRYSNFVELFHNENTEPDHCKGPSFNTACNKCQAIHPVFIQHFDDESSNVNIKCTNISKGNFSDEYKTNSCPAKPMYFDGINSFMNNNKNKQEFLKSKMYGDSLDDECNNISSVISKELSQLYYLKDTLRQLEEYDKQMNIKINDVLKLRKAYHSAKLNKNQNLEKKECLKKKVTVPGPFNLSPPKKCNKRADMKPVEKKEIFHATPIPYHLHQPLCEKLTEKEEKKIIERKAANVKKLKANVKPDLSITKCQNYKREFQSVPDLRDLTAIHADFKAKPVPCFMYNSFVEKNKREEQKRQIRIKQRSETLLKQSSLPFSERKVTQTRIKNLSKSLDNLNKKLGNKQELNNKIYDTFKKKTTTVCQPFHFRTEERQLNKMKNAKTLYENEYNSCTACNTPKKMPFQIAEKPTSVPFSYPVNKKTHSSMLRDHYVRQQLQMKQEEMERKLQKLGEKLEKENCFFSKYGWKLKMLDSTEDVRKAIQMKLRSNRKMASQRQHEYKTELKEMKERVHRRPLLVEMQAAMSSIGRLEKCYNLALERAGVNTDFVEELSGRYKEWDYHKPHNMYEEEINNSDISCSEQGSELDGDNSEPSHSARTTSDESHQNSQHSSRTNDDYAEHSSNYDATSQCSQQSVISNKELVHSSSESTNSVP